MDLVQAEINRDALTHEIIGGAIEVHRELGPGLLESAYEQCLAWELENRKLRVTRQVPLPVIYKGIRLDCGYRLDLVVDDAVIVEIKAVDELNPIHEAQLLTYLRLTRRRTGLLINFNKKRLHDGVKRMVL